MTIPEAIRGDIERIGEDEVSGATAILLRALAVLTAPAARPHLAEIADRIARAQPSMAGLQTAAALARRGEGAVPRLAALADAVGRAPAAIARLAVPRIRLRHPGAAGPLTIVTCSRSATVERTLQALAVAEPIRVRCAESRPAREGVGLAEALAANGTAEVELYTDAGIGQGVPGADAIVIGADAVSTEGVVNKAGSAALVALAAAHGVAVFVLAGREKIVPARVFRALPLREAPPTTVHSGAAAYTRRDPWFERIPAILPFDLVTDGGVVPVGEVLGMSYWI